MLSMDNSFRAEGPENGPRDLQQTLLCLECHFPLGWSQPVVF